MTVIAATQVTLAITDAPAGAFVAELFKTTICSVRMALCPASKWQPPAA